MHINEFNETDQVLLKRAKDILYGNIRTAERDQQGNSLFDSNRAIVPSPSTYLGFWNWDAAFHLLGMSYFDPVIAQEQARIMFKFQLENGQFVDCVMVSGKIVDGFSKPPVWGWAIMRGDKIAPDDSFLRYAYPYLQKNVRWWETYRYDKTLFSYKINKYESGWDTSVRWDFPNKIDNLYAVDCNCFMYSYYEAMEYIADRLHLQQDRKNYQAQKEALAHNINKFLYNNKTNMYCDYNYKRKKFTGKISPASFLPLWCGIANEAQAGAMRKLAQSRDYFYCGIPTISYNNKKYNSGKYWRGPCWLNTAYFAIRGLLNYGYEDLALNLCDNILSWCYREGDYYEYYDSKTGKGLGAQRFGWSAVFVMELVLLRNKK